MIDPSFTIVSARTEPHAAAPTLVLRLRIAAANDAAVHTGLVRCDIPWDGDLQRLQRSGIGEPRLDVAHRLKGADHQAGADQQDECESHLHDRERVARNIAVTAGARVAAALIGAVVVSSGIDYIALVNLVFFIKAVLIFPLVLAIFWQRTILQPKPDSPHAVIERWEWLKNLKPERREHDVSFVHASPRDPLFEYVLREDFARANAFHKHRAQIANYGRDEIVWP